MDCLSDDEKLLQLVRELDSSIVKSGATVQIYSEADEHHGGIVANRLGYLRLGIEMLKAATAPAVAKDQAAKGNLEIDTSYLVDPSSAFVPQWFTRTEDIKSILTCSAGQARLMMFGTLAVLAVGVMLAIIGLVSVVTWLL